MHVEIKLLIEPQEEVSMRQLEVLEKGWASDRAVDISRTYRMKVVGSDAIT